MALVEFGDETDEHIEVDNVLWVEIPSDSDRCNVLVLHNGRKIWGYMDKSEVWKIKRYKDDIFEEETGLRLRVRDLRRRHQESSCVEKLFKWLRNE